MTVVIPTFNQPEMLLEAIQSVEAQTYRNFEIVVVDDGSTDDTRQRLAQMVNDDRIHYVWQRNKRQAAARNMGIKVSTGDLIAFLDHDDLWHKRKLELQVPLFDDPDVGLTYTGAEEIDLQGRFLWTKGLEHFARGDIFDQLLSRHFITNSSVVVRRSCLATTGLFREDFYGVDDTHMWLRICRRFHADYVPEVLVSCRNHPGNMKKDHSIMSEKQYLKLIDIFQEFGLNESRAGDWRHLNSEYQFFLGWRLARLNRRAAFGHFRRALGYEPQPRQILAICKLLIPGYYTFAAWLARRQ